MTHFFPTADQPQGWKLEDLLTEVQNDIVRRSEKIVDDMRPQARGVLHNNIEILALLTECIHKAEASTKILESLGRSESDHGGAPRIGRM
ncbi:MAG TPA: histidine kinase [Alphaproteobacteria bacterium]|jgi:hypothetical protein|nr:histidine kinase [Alphaproteobacteria bacterium]